MTQEHPVSWRGVVYGTPVMSGDGQTVGKVREMLGDDSEDIFHGIRVQLSAGKREIMVKADDVAELDTDAVKLALDRASVEALPDWKEEATYHLASVGWLRKHLGWQQDSKSDEEPG